VALSAVFVVFAQVLVPILVVVGSGYALQRGIGLDVGPINRLTIYLLNPALIFTLLVQVRVESSETVRIVAFMVLFVLAIGAITWLSSRALGLDAAATAAMLLCAMFMNAGNYGLPVARFAFGQEGFERAALFFVVQVILAQTLAIYIAGAGHGDLREGLARLLRMPPLYAVLTALAVRFGGMRSALMGDGVLGDLFRGVALVGDATVPILLVVLGLQLAEIEVIDQRRLVALAAGLRLVLSVPIALLLAGSLGLDELSTKLAVILASMPTAVNMTIFAIEFDVRPRFVSSVVTTSTVASLVTLTVLLAFVGVT
jgi:predicted permease